MPFLQRWIGPIALIFHGLSMAFMLRGFQALQGFAGTEWIKKEKGGHYQFLTIQGLFASIIVMGLALLSDAIPSFSFASRLKRVMLMIALPLSVVISSIYWTLLAVGPHLLLPPEPEAVAGEPSSSNEVLNLVRIPVSIDLALHALPAVALFLEFFLAERKYSREAVRIGAPLMSLAYGIGYACWVEYCSSFNGRFPYPFLEHPLNVRAAIYAVVTTVAFLSFRGLNALHS